MKIVIFRDYVQKYPHNYHCHQTLVWVVHVNFEKSTCDCFSDTSSDRILSTSDQSPQRSEHRISHHKWSNHPLDRSVLRSESL